VAAHSPTDHEYQLVVPVANEDNVEQLMRTAMVLVKDRDAEILVMHAVKVPHQTPYSAAQDRVDEGRPVVERAMDVAEAGGVPVSGTIRIAHDPADAIQNTVEQYDSDAVLMGWGGYSSSRRDVVLGSTVDEITTEADADVFVENVGTGESDGEVGSILLPWTDNLHADLAAETARSIATSEDATVDIVRVLETDDDDREEAEESLETATACFEDDGVSVETHLVEDDDVAETLSDAAEDHDVTVMAAESEGFLRKLVFGAVPESVGNRVASTTIMVRRNVSTSSRLKRLFS
jgi:nucleotide-binding universal stress UspA family protein